MKMKQKRNVWVALSAVLWLTTVGAETPPVTAMPDASDAPMDCPLAMQEAEMGFERGQQAASAKRWAEARHLFAEAGAAYLAVAAHCPALAAQANRQGDRATDALKTAEAASTHHTECQPRLDKALDLDLKAAALKSDKGEPAQIERLLAEAETTWREATERCHPPHREKAEKSLAATQRARAANAELLSAGPACDTAWKNATALADYARAAWKEKRWDDAAALYSKSVLAWEGAADKCLGSRQEQAVRKVAQTQIDAHNAEHCGPLWDHATDQTQALRTAAPAVSATEKEVLSVRAEAAWRDAVSFCRGSPQSLARTNADAIARERGTPLPPNAVALYGTRKPPPSAAAVNAPQPAPVKVVQAPAAAVKQPVSAPPPPAAASPVVASVSSTAAPATAAPASAVATSPAAAPAGEVVVTAGDTTYRGNFILDRKSGAVSGTGSVEWTNGERYVGQLLEGRKHGKGRFEWVGGQWYEGDWANDQAVGYGVIRFANGIRYEGAVKDGEPSGRGTQVFPSGDRYTGEFLKGVFHGRGAYAWKAGNRYEGSWNMGRKHGHGRLSWAGGGAWEGEFQNDQQTEKGREIAASAK